MSEDEEIKVGVHAILVDSDGKIILQQRDNNPGIINPGLIAIFGGSLELGDSIESGLQRELMEELELNLESYSVEKFGIYRKTKAIDGQDYEAHVFVVKPVDENILNVHEGLGYVCDYPANILKSDKLTRVARLVVEDYLKRI